MGMSKVSSLDEILDQKKDVKLRLVLLSELELATKLSDPGVLYEVGEQIRQYDGNIDAVVINGGLAEVPNKYSKRRGERLDLLEDRLKERYGEKVYKLVKENAGSDSVDSLEEAVRLAKLQMQNIVTQTRKKNAKIYYIFSENDYKNVETLISVFEKVSAYFDKSSAKKEAEEPVTPAIRGVDSELLEFLQKSYNVKASQWKNKDKQGIKDTALNIYKQWILSIFSETKGGASGVEILGDDGKSNISTLKRYENDIVLNGVKIRAVHAINGRYSGNSEGKPTERGTVMAIEKLNLDKVQDKLADLYLRGDESATSFTAVDMRGKKGPVYLVNCGPLQDLDGQIRKMTSWNKTRESKRVDQPEDSAMLVFTLRNNNIADMEHISFDGLKNKVNTAKMRKNPEKELYEITHLSDTHIGSPSLETTYELMEAFEIVSNRSKMPRDRRFLLLLGDILHAGADKASWTDILWPKRPIYDDLLDKLENPGSQEEKVKLFRRLVYGVALPDLGMQNAQVCKTFSRVAKNYSKVFATPGNHVQKAATFASETGLYGPIFSAAGTEVIYADQISRDNEQIMLGNYKIYMLHSPGYRGGVDAGTALLKKAIKTGSDVDMAFAGDCHEEHAVYVSKKVDGKWKTMFAGTSAALQDRTMFESEIISKNDFTKGFEITYVPSNSDTGTTYLRHVFIPSQAMHEILKDNGGSRLEKIVKSKYS